MNFGQQSRVLSLHLVHRAQGDCSNHFLVKKGESYRPSNTVITITSVCVCARVESCDKTCKHTHARTHNGNTHTYQLTHHYSFVLFIIAGFSPIHFFVWFIIASLSLLFVFHLLLHLFITLVITSLFHFIILIHLFPKGKKFQK